GSAGQGRRDPLTQLADKIFQQGNVFATLDQLLAQMLGHQDRASVDDVGEPPLVMRPLGPRVERNAEILSTVDGLRVDVAATWHERQVVWLGVEGRFPVRAKC